MIDLKKYVNVKLDTSAVKPGFNSGTNVVFVEALQNISAGYYEGLIGVNYDTDIDTIYNRDVANNTGPQFHTAFVTQFIAGNNEYNICAINPDESEAVYEGGELPTLPQLFAYAGYNLDGGQLTKGLIYGKDNREKNIFSDLQFQIVFTDSSGQSHTHSYMLPGSVLNSIYSYSLASYYDGNDSDDFKIQYAYSDYSSLILSLQDVSITDGGLKMAISQTTKTVNGQLTPVHKLVIATISKGDKASIDSITVSQIAGQRGSQVYAISKFLGSRIPGDALNANQSIDLTFKNTNGQEKTATLTIVNQGSIDALIDEMKEGYFDNLVNEVNAAFNTFTTGDEFTQSFVQSLRLTYFVDKEATQLDTPNRYFVLTSTNRELNEKVELIKVKDTDGSQLLTVLGFSIDTSSDVDLSAAKTAGLVQSSLKAYNCDVLSGGIVFNLASGVSTNTPGHGNLIENGTLMKHVKALCDAKNIEPTHMVISRTLTYDSLMNATDLDKVHNIAVSFSNYMNDVCILFLHTSTTDYEKAVVLDGVSGGYLRNIVMIYDPNLGNYVDGALAKYLSSINYYLPAQARNLLGLQFQSPIAACNISTSQMNKFDMERVNAYAMLSTGQSIFQTGYTSDEAAIPYIDMTNGINHMIRSIKATLASALVRGNMTIDEDGRNYANVLVSSCCDFYVSSGLLGGVLTFDSVGNEVYEPPYTVSIDAVTNDYVSSRTFPPIRLYIHCKAYVNTISVVITETTNSVVTTTVSSSEN